MTYRVVLTPRAERERDEAFVWFGENFSVDFAIAWYGEIAETIAGLANDPLRHSLAPEGIYLPYELRETSTGRLRDKNRYRLFFTVEGDTVVVLHLRHMSRKPPSPDEFVVDR